MYALASLVAQIVKNLPAMLQTPVLSLGRKDPLEKQMATHFSILAWRIPWREGRKESDTTEGLTLSLLVVQLVVFGSCQFHGLQHARPPCPSLSPRVRSNSRPLSR